MRHICLFTLSVILSLVCTAQEQYIPENNVVLYDSIAYNDTNKILLLVDIMDNVIVHQDSSIYRLMLDKYLGVERGLQEVTGFRVQVYSSNSQQKAKNESMLLHQELAKQISEPIYVISEPPFWKVRVGNFRTREEATQYKDLIMSLFPELQTSTYVVPDKITVLN